MQQLNDSKPTQVSDEGVEKKDDSKKQSAKECLKQLHDEYFEQDPQFMQKWFPGEQVIVDVEQVSDIQQIKEEVLAEEAEIEKQKNDTREHNQDVLALIMKYVPKDVQINSDSDY